MSQMRFNVLGPLTVFVAGRQVPLPSGRRRSVLACLLVHAGHPVAADAVVEAAWGDDLPASPRTALNTVISRLRAHLGTDVLRAEPAGYVLDASGDAIDAQAFEDAVTRARSAGAHDAASLLDTALGLWRGNAYVEFADRDFASIEAERLEQLRLEAVEARSAIALDLGDPQSAVVALEALLAQQPYRERAVELLMRGLCSAGRQVDALECLRDYRRRLRDELGLDPSAELVALQARILERDNAQVSTNIDEPPVWVDTSTAFVGRADALDELCRASVANRVVTVTGPGGVGKTRLLAEALPAVTHRLRLPSVIVELATVTRGNAARAIADALELGHDSQTVQDVVVEHLSHVAAIVVLDNCEHLLHELTPLVALIGRHCRGIHVLCSSRHPLGLEAETVIPLAPLSVPHQSQSIESQQLSVAVRLFTDRVRRRRPSFGLTTENTPAVAEICRSVDGLPLALELAASRVATLGLTEVSGIVAGGESRLMQVVDWSYQLLSLQQRMLLNGLSTFSGAIGLQEVSGFAHHLNAWSGDIEVALAELVDSSLLTVQEHEGEVRYRMLEIVRSFAGQMLVDAGAFAAASQAHAEWVRDEADRLARAWRTDDGADVAPHLDALVADAESALEWALETRHLDLAASIARAFSMCLHWTPAAELIELVIRTAEACAKHPAPQRAEAVGAGAFFAAEHAEHERSRRLATAALAMSTEHGQRVMATLARGVSSLYEGKHEESAEWFSALAAFPGYEGEGNSSLALIACYHDDLESARVYARLALAVRRSGSDATFAFAQYAAGEVASRTSPDHGARLLAEAGAEAERVGAEQVSRVARIALLALLVRTRSPAAAAHEAIRVLRALRRNGLWVQIWTTLRLITELLAASGRPQDAALLLCSVDAAPTAPPLIHDDAVRYAALRANLDEQLGERVMRGIAALAASIPRAQLVDRAIDMLGGRLSE